MSKKAQKRAAQVSNVLKDERVPKITGLLLVLTSVYLFIAFVSYLFTWDNDQDAVNFHAWSIIFEPDVEIHNWLGKLGAIASHQLVYLGFGLPSFGLIGLSFTTGIAMIKRTPLSRLWRLYRYASVVIIWSSMTLAFIFNELLGGFFYESSEAVTGFPWGGAVGLALCEWLRAFLGLVGVFAFLVFSVFAAIVWTKNPNLENLSFDKVKEDVISAFRMDSISRIFASFKVDETDEEDEDDETETDEEGMEDVATRRTRRGITATAPISPPLDPVDPFTHAENIPPIAPPVREPSNPELAELARRAREMTQGQLEIPNEPGDTPVLRPRTGAPSLNSDFEVNLPPVAAFTSVPDATPDIPDSISDVTSEIPNFTDPYDPTLDLASFENPHLQLLEQYSQNDITEDRSVLEQNKDQIISTLLNYKIEIVKISATVGPTVTLFEIVPAPGVRISKIKNLEDDIALSLAALGIRIIAPIPGKGTIGIEVPNRNKKIVSLREVLESERFRRAQMELPIALGKTISNEVFVADLAKMPHLLVAGATGQGKSVGINTILMSLIFKKHPSQVKFVLVDPKKVELSPYSKMESHYLAFLPSEEEPIVTDTSRAVQTLHSLTIEMDERYSLLKKANVRHILEYNGKFVQRRLNPEKGHRFLPYIILVVDEFADLIMTAGKEVELPIGRLAQLARAVGIHLIIATQRPSVNIITGVIKANFPARLAFKVTSKIDSRTILDSGGADQLIGRGDMLLSLGSDLIRLQCAFVDTPEVERVIDFIAAQKGYPEPHFLPEYGGPDMDGGAGGNSEMQRVLDDLDEFFEDSARLVVIHQSGSTSLIQRRLKLGYNRAGRIMDQLHATGICGPNEGSKPREVHFQDEVELEKYLVLLRSKYGGR